jgi:hypothetical protein
MTVSLVVLLKSVRGDQAAWRSGTLAGWLAK